MWYKVWIVYFLPGDIQLFQHHCWKNHFFSTRFPLHQCEKHVCVDPFLHWSTGIYLYKYHVLLITYKCYCQVVLNLQLRSFPRLLTILGSLHFCLCFMNSICQFLQKACWNFDWSYLELVDESGRSDTWTICSLPADVDVLSFCLFWFLFNSSQ